MMRGLLQRLFDRCSHKWIEDQRWETSTPGRDMIIGMTSFCHCEKCGERRSFRMDA